MFLLLLLTLAFAADDQITTDLDSLQTSGYVFDSDQVSSFSEAQGKCTNHGMSVCTPDQLYTVVYGDVGGQRYSDMCHGGFVDASAESKDQINGMRKEYQTLKDDPFASMFGSIWERATPEGEFAGWFSSKTYNSDGTSFCGGQAGWRENAGAQAGSHCCGAQIVATAKVDAGTCAGVSCSSSSSLSGNSMSLERSALGGTQRCVGQTCQSNACCESISVEAPYKHVEGRFEDLAAADAACKSQAGSQFGVCHQDSIEGIYGSSDFNGLLGQSFINCQRGWVISDYGGDLASSFGFKGFYNTNFGSCLMRASGWIDDYYLDGTADVHCCMNTMKVVEDIEWIGTADRTNLAENACGNEFHHTQVCTKLQHTLAGMNEDWDTDCKYSLNYADNTRAGSVEGHYQHLASDSCQDSLIGWIDAPRQVNLGGHPAKLNAACCSPYAKEAEDVPTVYVRSPADDYSFGYSSGALAEQHCNSLGNGTFTLCSQEQVAWVGSYLDGFKDMCRVGWSKAGGDFVHGFYHTENGNSACGKAAEWNDNWRPSPPRHPLAHCCLPSVETVTVSTPHYYNGDWDYQYSTGESARAVCTATAGFDLCTLDQLYTVALHGIYVNGAMVQREEEMARVGWYRDEPCNNDNECEFNFGWVQGKDGYAGKAGDIVTLSAQRGDEITYHCCSGFEIFRSQPPTHAPSMTAPYMVTLAAPVGAAGNIYPNQASALAGCKAKDSEYVICTDQQVVHYAQFGFTQNDLPVAQQGQWQDVFPNNAICTYGFVDGQQATCGSAVDKHVGYFQVAESRSCGQGWMSASSSKNNNAFCCAPGIQVSSSHDFKADLGCPDSDCDFEWSECGSDCYRAYTKHADAQGNGAVCAYGNGYREQCTGGQCIPTDCQGDFSPCNASCKKSWKTTTPAAGGGHCNYLDEQQVDCAPGAGECPRADDRDCVHDFTACTADCKKTFVVITPAKHNGKCPYAPNSVHSCTNGEGLCPPNANCVASFSDCGTDCMRTWTISTEPTGDGSCEHENGYREFCVGENCTGHSNCVGEWDGCDGNCMQRFLISTPAKGRGTCAANNGDTRVCLPGSGACPMNRDCTGRWSTCSSSCVRTWAVITPPAGSGASCFPDGYQETCNNGDCVAVSELYEAIPSDVCNGLGIGQSQCDNLFFKKDTQDEFYVYATGSYRATCVAYNADASTDCPRGKVCGGCLRHSIGSLKKIGRLVRTAMAQTDGMHPHCQTYKSCEAVNPGFAPQYGNVQYYKCDNDPCYYMNTMFTCVCNNNDVANELEWSFKDSFNFQNPTCAHDPNADATPVEEIIDHQLCITEDMIEDLENKINTMPDVHQQLVQAESEILNLINGWSTQIETLLNNNGSQEAAELLQKLQAIRG